MYLAGTDPIHVHPTKVEEMKRKGWSTSPINTKESKNGNSQRKWRHCQSRIQCRSWGNRIQLWWNCWNYWNNRPFQFGSFIRFGFGDFFREHWLFLGWNGHFRARGTHGRIVGDAEFVPWGCNDRWHLLYRDCNRYIDFQGKRHRIDGDGFFFVPGHQCLNVGNGLIWAHLKRLLGITEIS